MSRRSRHRRPRRRHAPVGQVGPQLRRVRHRGRPRALADAGMSWDDVEYVAGADTIRNGYPGFIAGATFSQALGWKGNRWPSCYAACASGAQAISRARAQILAGLCDVALVVGADTTPKGFFAPVGGDRPDDPDWLRFRLLGATNPTYFALYARRRMELYGATVEDFAQVKVKNARHGLATRTPATARRSPSTTYGVADGRRSAAAARHLRHLRRRRRHRARRWSTPAHTARRRPGRVSAIRTVTPTYPADDHRDAELRHRLGRVVGAARAPFRDSIAARRLRGGRARSRRHRPGRGLRPLDGARARLVREHRPLQGGRGREAPARRRHDRSAAASRSTPAGVWPRFGEAIPAQAIAQVCELTWQLRGQADGRQVERRHGRHHREPGPVRPRFERHLRALRLKIPQSCGPARQRVGETARSGAWQPVRATLLVSTIRAIMMRRTVGDAGSGNGRRQDDRQDGTGFGAHRSEPRRRGDGPRTGRHRALPCLRRRRRRGDPPGDEIVVVEYHPPRTVVVTRM